jgi:hypothetical protein
MMVCICVHNREYPITATPSVKEQLLNEFDKLSPEQQQRVLEFTRSLRSTLPPGTPGEVLIELAKELNFDPQDLAEMQAAIEDPETGCEKIDWEEW